MKFAISLRKMNRPIKIFCNTCNNFPKDIEIIGNLDSIVIECKKCGTAINLKFNQRKE